MRNNTVCKGFYSTEITREQAKGIKSIDDLINIIMADPEPQDGKAFMYSNSDEELTAETNANGTMNSSADAYICKTYSGSVLHASCTALEYYEADEDGDFIEGSDYDEICKDFSESAIDAIKEFCPNITIKYMVEYTDSETGACSPIDTITAQGNYTAEDYRNDCEDNGVIWGDGEITLTAILD